MFHWETLLIICLFSISIIGMLTIVFFVFWKE